MKNLEMGSSIGVALAAAAAAVGTALYVPFGQPWPTVALALLSCGTLVATGMRSVRPDPSIFDVITVVEGERASLAPVRTSR